MTNDALVPFVTAKDAKMRFGQLLDIAMKIPVAITRHNRHVAYIVSRRDFDALTARVATLEAQLARAYADQAAFELALRTNAESVASLLPDPQATVNH